MKELNHRTYFTKYADYFNESNPFDKPEELCEKNELGYFYASRATEETKQIDVQEIINKAWEKKKNVQNENIHLIIWYFEERHIHYSKDQLTKLLKLEIIKKGYDILGFKNIHFIKLHPLVAGRSY